MLPFIIALLVIPLAVFGIVLLLRSMGENGVEAAAPGSCKSGRCGVHAPVQDPSADTRQVQGQVVRIEDYRHRDTP
jgi:hypothetical protein